MPELVLVLTLNRDDFLKDVIFDDGKGRHGGGLRVTSLGGGTEADREGMDSRRTLFALGERLDRSAGSLTLRAGIETIRAQPARVHLLLTRHLSPSRAAHHRPDTSGEWGSRQERASA